MSARPRLVTGCLLIAALAACTAPTEKKTTLGDIDRPGGETGNKRVYIAPKSDAEIRQAYADYIKHADKDDHSRLAAITRLAEIEFELSNKLLEEQQGELDEAKKDARYTSRLNKTIELLTTSLEDYPEADNNDRLLYQLAKAYDQKGEYEKALDALEQLVARYPESPYYVEARFRLGEAAFSAGDYRQAEDAYTEVIISPKSDVYYEKALFKRGWARFKQQFYELAVDDFLEAVTFHRFDEIEKLDESEKDQFNEYFRSIGLAFSYLGGVGPLHTYFQNNRDFKYIYYTYSTISDIYLKQERYSDAANALQQFIEHYPESKNIPYAHLDIIKIWRQSGFTRKLHPAVETFYTRFNPSSDYWETGAATEAVDEAIESALKEYVMLEAEYFHNRYQQSGQAPDFEQAARWYERYLEHYASYARQDGIHYLYAELLAQAGRPAEAVRHYEQAAFDGEMVLNKDAAYAAVHITSRLYNAAGKQEKSKWLDKHIQYALRYSRLYPNEAESENVVLHASELAFADGRYEQTVRLAGLLTESADPESRAEADILTARAYFELEEYADAEEMYQRILDAATLNGEQRREVEDGLALAVYRQAESADEAGDTQQAYNHYTRIHRLVPDSDIAATGLYDGIALAMNGEHWRQAVRAIKTFQSAFPGHKYSKDVTKKLSVAYLNSDEDLKAAAELEKLSSLEEDRDVKMAALWQSAELHKKKENFGEAIRVYEQYARTYNKPFPQYLESMHILTELYESTDRPDKADQWRREIVQADKKAYKKDKTERTRTIASKATLKLAKKSHREFERIDLVEPLDTALRRKRAAMQDAVQLYGQASTYGIHEITTEATFSIAAIYEAFSHALLNSERPSDLSGEELNQYEILLEDRAFPFEDKAIEFHETNMSRIKEGGFNEWLAKSHARLKELFPVRYARNEKVDSHFKVVQ